MSVEGPGSNGSDGRSDPEDIVRAIEKARALALAGDHKFLIYLLDMARIEAAALTGKKKP